MPFKLLCVGFIMFSTGSTVTRVGTVSTNCGEPYPLYMVAIVFLVMAVPAVTAYLAGLDDGEKATRRMYKLRPPEGEEA